MRQTSSKSCATFCRRLTWCNGTKHATTEYCAALRLLDTITGEASLEYIDVIRQCIECHSNQGAASLDNNNFREAVYDNEVTVLEEEANRFART